MLEWFRAFYWLSLLQGENAQLQMELSRMEKIKDNLTSEMARLSNEAEKLELLSSKHEDLEKKYQEIESDYQTMLTVSYLQIHL